MLKFIMSLEYFKATRLYIGYEINIQEEVQVVHAAGSKSNKAMKK